jgi:hypothetical protein
MGNYQSKLMSKNGKVIMQLSRELITCNIGERIKTVEEYANIFRTGRGTVQGGLKFLEEEEALKLESRGRLGTYIVKIDYEKLWSISNFGTIMGVMPLPYSKRYEGLATGLYKAFEKAKIPFSLAFMRGASKRLEALKLGKYDFVVTSKLAVNVEMSYFSNIEIAYEFGPKSYVGQHVVIFREKNVTQIEDGMRIGIDTSSPDQYLLTKYECEGKKVEYIETSYNQIIKKIESGEINAAIWNEDEIKEKGLNLNICSLKNVKTINISNMDTIAALVVNKNNDDFKNVVSKFINMNIIKHIQNEVLDGKLIPSY